MIGCGVQAKTQLMALHTVFPDLLEVRCYDVLNDAAVAYASEMHRRTGLNIRAVDSVRDAAIGADIIVTVTVADEPILKSAYVKKGSLVVHVGSYQEEEEDVVHDADKIIVDEWASVYHRKTPILAKMCLEGKLKEKDIYANLGEIVNGKKQGRHHRDERIFLLPIGMGSEDVIAAYEIYRLARAKGLGTELKLCEQFII
jgi:ornithine cyclodeaminase